MLKSAIKYIKRKRRRIQLEYVSHDTSLQISTNMHINDHCIANLITVIMWLWNLNHKYQLNRADYILPESNYFFFITMYFLFWWNCSYNIYQFWLKTSQNSFATRSKSHDIHPLVKLVKDKEEQCNKYKESLYIIQYNKGCIFFYEGCIWIL